MGSHSSRRVISPSSNSSASGAQSPGRRVSGSSHSYDSHSVEVTIPFFDDLYPKRVKMVNDLFYRQRYAAGDVIVDENKVGVRHHDQAVIENSSADLFLLQNPPPTCTTTPTLPTWNSVRGH